MWRDSTAAECHRSLWCVPVLAITSRTTTSARHRDFTCIEPDLLSGPDLGSLARSPQRSHSPYSLDWGHAMFSCWLLAVGLDMQHPRQQRYLWLAGGVTAVLAVLASQSRGAFVVVPWWLGVSALLAWRMLGKINTQAAHGKRPVLHRPGFHANRPGLDTCAGAPPRFIAGCCIRSTVGMESPWSWRQYLGRARMYMWQRSLPAIADSPGFGHGTTGRKQLIQQWAQESINSRISPARAENCTSADCASTCTRALRPP